jgi:hypothetical protein
MSSALLSVLLVYNRRIRGHRGNSATCFVHFDRSAYFNFLNFKYVFSPFFCFNNDFFKLIFVLNLCSLFFNYPTSTRRHGNFAGVHTLLRILLSSNSAVLINIITGVSPPHFDFVVYYVRCQC